MNRLMKFQLRNIFHNKLFYVCLCINLLMGPIVNCIVSNKDTVFSQIMSFITGEVGIISMIFVALFCTFDFNDGTTKNIVARGYSKTKLFISKLLSSLIGLLAVYVVVILVTFVLFIKNGLGFESNMLLLLVNSIFSIIAYTVFYGTLAFLLEKNGSAIMACLFVPTVVTLLTGVMDSKLKLDISKFWIDNVSLKFLEKPILSNLTMPIILYVVYIVVFIFVGINLLKRKEIK